jgi:hypothetical protein
MVWMSLGAKSKLFGLVWILEVNFLDWFGLVSAHVCVWPGLDSVWISNYS